MGGWPTAETSAGGRGRHTTTRRDLVPLPGGGLLVDTPGMRELQLWADEQALDTTFPEVSELARPATSPTALTRANPAARSSAALLDGSLPAERYGAWRKLQREIRALEVRRDARLRAQSKREAKMLERSLRRHYGG